MPHRSKSLSILKPFGKLSFRAFYSFAVVALMLLSTTQAQASEKTSMDSFLESSNVAFDSLELAQQNRLILAFDEDSPASFLQRVQLAATVLYDVDKKETAYSNRNMVFNPKSVFEAKLFCPIYDVAQKKQRAAYKYADNFIAQQLMMGQYRRCGLGILSSVYVDAYFGENYTIRFTMRKKVDVDSSIGTFRSKHDSLSYILELNSSSHRFLDLIRSINQSPEIRQNLLSDFRKSSLGFDLLAGIDAINDAINNEPAQSRQAENVVRNYQLYSFTPRREDDGLVLKKGLRTSHVGSEFLFHAPPLSNFNAADTEYRKAVLSFRPIIRNRETDLETIFGEAHLVSDIGLKGKWNNIVQNSRISISKYIERHADSFAKTGIGSMYGPNSSYAKMPLAEKARYLAQNKKPGTFPAMPTETSCIGFVLGNLNYGYNKSGLGKQWDKIDAIVRENSGQGTYLLNELRKDGWKIIFWSPDAKNPTTRVASASKDADHHQWAYAMARDNKGYMPGVLSYGKVFEGVPVDYLALNYRPTDPRITLRNIKAEEILRKIPFFVGVANGGYHVFMGSDGMVIESHSTRNPSDQTNIEIRPLNQFGLLRGESYLSGIIAVPPGEWMDGINGRYIE